MNPERTPSKIAADWEDYRPLTPEEAAAWLKLAEFGYDVDTLLRWVADNKIEHIRIGHKVAFLREQLIRFVKMGTAIDSPIRRLKKVC